MSHSVGTYQINAFWESGNLIYYEKQVGHTATGDVLTIGTEAVKIGGTLQDVDFQWYGSSSKSFILNKGAATAVSAGLAWTITGDLAVTGAITLTGDVSLEGDLTLTTEDVSVAVGRSIYLDGQDGGEYLRSDTANEVMLNATTSLHLAVAGTDEYDFDASTLALNANTVTEAGDIICNNAAGPTLQDEAATTTNPTLIPNRADETTGVGWNTSELHLVVAGVDEVAVSATAVTLASSTLTVSAGAISVAQGYSIYLDGLNGGEFLISDASNEATLNATTTLNLAIGGTDEVSISSSAVTLATNALILSAGAAAVAQGYSIYLDGNSGGEFLISDAANEATLNATTTLNLAIGGVDEFSINATTITSGATTLTLTGGNLALTADDFISGAPIKQTITNKSANATLTTAESGLITVSTDAIYIYLPALAGNTGICYSIKALASYTEGIYVGGNGGTETVDGQAKWKSGAENNAITVVANASDWNIINKVGTWS